MSAVKGTGLIHLPSLNILKQPQLPRHLIRLLFPISTVTTGFVALNYTVKSVMLRWTPVMNAGGRPLSPCGVRSVIGAHKGNRH